MLADVARRASNVRGLLWRSHPEARTPPSRTTHVLAGRERGRRRGPARQPCPARRQSSPEDRRHPPPGVPTVFDVAFVGGIDLAHGRQTTARTAAIRQRSTSTGDVRRPPALARRAPRGAGPGGRRRRHDASRALGRSRTDSTVEPVAGRCCTGRPRSHEPGSTSRRRPTAARGPVRGAGAADVSGPPAVPTRSRPTGSAVSPARTSRRSGGPDGWSTSRTSTSGRSTAPAPLADALDRQPDLRRGRRGAALSRTRPAASRRTPAATATSAH